MRRAHAYWICQGAGWFFYAAVLTLFAVLYYGFAWAIVGTYAFLAVLGIGSTHLYRAYLVRHGWRRLPLRRLIPRVVLACLLLALAIQVPVGLLSAAVLELVPAGTYTPGVAVSILFNLSATLLVWSLLYFGVHYFRRYRHAEVEKWKLEAAVKEAELRALRAQVNPHFLFNSLNSIRALITSHPARAQQVVTQLAALLRYALQSGTRTTVPLAEELQIVRTYLALEATRLEERLRYTIDADARADAAPVPPMLVQTLVENGIKYGVATRPEGGFIHVEARRRDDALELRVVNSGRLHTDGSSTGVGLQNAAERLRLLFGGAATLHLDSTDDDTVTARVRIPLPPPSPDPTYHPRFHDARVDH